MSSTRTCLRALAVCVLTLAMSAGTALADLTQQAVRQLELAESDLAAGSHQRAADAAASAFRLDGSLHVALLVQGLALRHLGRTDDAKALLTTYITIRGDLPLDGRARTALIYIQVEEQIAAGKFDPALALTAADEVLLELETSAARAYVTSILKSDRLKPKMVVRALEIWAQSHWIDGDEAAARQVWRQLFADHSGATVDADLPPGAMTAMAEEQRAVRAASPTSTVAVGAGPAPPAPHPASVILLGAGGGVAAFGLAFSGGSHRAGEEIWAGGESSQSHWNEGNAEYAGFRSQEQAGAVLAAAGSAALVGGLVHLLVTQANKKQREAGAVE